MIKHLSSLEVISLVIIFFSTISSYSAPMIIPSKLICKAHDVFIPGASSEQVILQIDNSNDPLVISNSSEDSNLNFLIGRGNVSGQSVTPADGFTCTPTVTISDQLYTFIYSCEGSITDTDGSKKVFANFKSQFELRSTRQGLLCQSVDQGGSICWNLSDCK